MATFLEENFLQSFYAAQDLEVITTKAIQLHNALTPDLKQSIKETLEKDWEEEPQAIANLLQNPFLIDDDTRATYLIKGLKEKDQAYLILSAILGIQSRKFASQTTNEMKDILLELIGTSYGSIAKRAFTSVEEHLTQEDTKRIIQFLTHHDKVVRENAAAWIQKEHNDKIESLTISLQESQTPPKVMKNLLDQISEYRAKLDRGEWVWQGLQLSFVPTETEFQRLENYRKVLQVMFNKAPKNEQGLMEATHLVAFMESIGKPITPEKAQQMFEIEDYNGKGGLDRFDFINLMDGKIAIPDILLDRIDTLTEEDEDDLFACFTVGANEEDAVTTGDSLVSGLDGLTELFNQFDRDQDGFLGVSDIQQSMSLLSGELTEVEAREMITNHDHDKDGRLSFEEFKLMMEKTMNVCKIAEDSSEEDEEEDTTLDMQSIAAALEDTAEDDKQKFAFDAIDKILSQGTPTTGGFEFSSVDFPKFSFPTVSAPPPSSPPKQENNTNTFSFSEAKLPVFDFSVIQFPTLEKH